jgi:hypothetical protein
MTLTIRRLARWAIAGGAVALLGGCYYPPAGAGYGYGGASYGAAAYGPSYAALYAPTPVVVGGGYWGGYGGGWYHHPLPGGWYGHPPGGWNGGYRPPPQGGWHGGGGAVYRPPQGGWAGHGYP